MDIWETPVRKNHVPVYRYLKYRYTSTKNTFRPKLRFTDWESAYEWCDALAAKFEVAGTSWTDGTITLMSTSSLMEAHDGNSEKSDGQSTTDEAQKNGAAARAHSLSKWQTTPTGQKSILVVCMDWIAGDTTDGAPSGSAQSTDCPTRTSTLMQTVKEEFERMSFNRVTIKEENEQ